MKDKGNIAMDEGTILNLALHYFRSLVMNREGEEKGGLQGAMKTGEERALLIPQV